MSFTESGIGASVSGLDGAGTSSGTNGTVAVTPKSVNLTGLSIANGVTFSLTIGVVDAAGSDNGLSVDNFTLTVVTALPIELKSFGADTKNGKVTLNWATASEKNNKEFIVERSTTASGFDKIASIAGAGSIGQDQSYMYEDAKPYQGVNYYRLRQVDYTGEMSFSNIVKVDVKSNTKVSIYPNPAVEVVQVTIEEEGSSSHQFLLLNSAGILIQEINMEAGETNTSINLADLSSGLYILMEKTEGGTISHRFTKK